MSSLKENKTLNLINDNIFEENNQKLIISNFGTSKQLSEYINDPVIYLIHLIHEYYGIGPASDYQIEVKDRYNELNTVFNKLINLQSRINCENLKLSDINYKEIINKFISIVNKFKNFFQIIYKNLKTNLNEALYQNPIIDNYLKKIDNELLFLKNNLCDKSILKKNNLNEYNSFSSLELKWKIRNFWVEYFIKNYMKKSNYSIENNTFKRLLKDNNLYSSMKFLKNEDKKLTNIKKNKKKQKNITKLNQFKKSKDDYEIESSNSNLKCIFLGITIAVVTITEYFSSK